MKSRIYLIHIRQQFSGFLGQVLRISTRIERQRRPVPLDDFRPIFCSFEVGAVGELHFEIGRRQVLFQHALGSFGEQGDFGRTGPH